MSVTRTHYVLFGYKLDFKRYQAALDASGQDEWDMDKAESEYADNGHQEQIGSKHGVTVIADGMNGEYVFVGVVMAKGRDEDGLEITECSLPKVGGYDALHAGLAHLWNDLGVTWEAVRPKGNGSHLKVWAFTHFS